MMESDEWPPIHSLNIESCKRKDEFTVKKWRDADVEKEESEEEEEGEEMR
jgi:hypothetical protein